MAGGLGTNGLYALKGVRAGVAASGVGYEGRPDLLFDIFDGGATVAGVLTTSHLAAAPVRWTGQAGLDVALRNRT